MAVKTDGFLSGLDSYVSNAISKLSYDKTIQATITEIKGGGKYSVTNGTNVFEAMGAEGAYQIDDTVFILIPGGDFDQEKTILRKKTSDTDTITEGNSARSKIVIVSDNLTKLYQSDATRQAILAIKENFVANAMRLIDLAKNASDLSQFDPTDTSTSNLTNLNFSVEELYEKYISNYRSTMIPFLKSYPDPDKENATIQDRTVYFNSFCEKFENLISETQKNIAVRESVEINNFNLFEEDFNSHRLNRLYFRFRPWCEAKPISKNIDDDGTEITSILMKGAYTIQLITTTKSGHRFTFEIPSSDLQGNLFPREEYASYQDACWNIDYDALLEELEPDEFLSLVETDGEEGPTTLPEVSFVPKKFEVNVIYGAGMTLSGQYVENIHSQYPNVTVNIDDYEIYFGFSPDSFIDNALNIWFVDEKGDALIKRSYQNSDWDADEVEPWRLQAAIYYRDSATGLVERWANSMQINPDKEVSLKWYISDYTAYKMANDPSGEAGWLQISDAGENLEEVTFEKLTQIVSRLSLQYTDAYKEIIKLEDVDKKEKALKDLITANRELSFNYAPGRAPLYFQQSVMIRAALYIDNIFTGTYSNTIVLNNDDFGKKEFVDNQEKFHIYSYQDPYAGTYMLYRLDGAWSSNSELLNKKLALRYDNQEIDQYLISLAESDEDIFTISWEKDTNAQCTCANKNIILEKAVTSLGNNSLLYEEEGGISKLSNFFVVMVQEGENLDIYAKAPATNNQLSIDEKINFISALLQEENNLINKLFKTRYDTYLEEFEAAAEDDEAKQTVQNKLLNKINFKYEPFDKELLKLDFVLPGNGIRGLNFETFTAKLYEGDTAIAAFYTIQMGTYSTSKTGTVLTINAVKGEGNQKQRVRAIVQNENTLTIEPHLWDQFGGDHIDEVTDAKWEWYSPKNEEDFIFQDADNLLYERELFEGGKKSAELKSFFIPPSLPEKTDNTYDLTKYQTGLEDAIISAETKDFNMALKDGQTYELSFDGEAEAYLEFNASRDNEYIQEQYTINIKKRLPYFVYSDVNYKKDMWTQVSNLKYQHVERTIKPINKEYPCTDASGAYNFSVLQQHYEDTARDGVTFGEFIISDLKDAANVGSNIIQLHIPGFVGTHYFCYLNDIDIELDNTDADTRIEKVNNQYLIKWPINSAMPEKITFQYVSLPSRYKPYYIFTLASSSSETTTATRYKKVYINSVEEMQEVTNSSHKMIKLLKNDQGSFTFRAETGDVLNRIYFQLYNKEKYDAQKISYLNHYKDKTDLNIKGVSVYKIKEGDLIVSYAWNGQGISSIGGAATSSDRVQYTRFTWRPSGIGEDREEKTFYQKINNKSDDDEYSILSPEVIPDNEDSVEAPFGGFGGEKLKPNDFLQYKINNVFSPAIAYSLINKNEKVSCLGEVLDNKKYLNFDSLDLDLAFDLTPKDTYAGYYYLNFNLKSLKINNLQIKNFDIVSNWIVPPGLQSDSDFNSFLFPLIEIKHPYCTYLSLDKDYTRADGYILEEEKMRMSLVLINSSVIGEDHYLLKRQKLYLGLFIEIKNDSELDSIYKKYSLLSAGGNNKNVELAKGVIDRSSLHIEGNRKDGFFPPDAYGVPVPYDTLYQTKITNIKLKKAGAKDNDKKIIKRNFLSNSVFDDGIGNYQILSFSAIYKGERQTTYLPIGYTSAEDLNLLKLTRPSELIYYYNAASNRIFADELDKNNILLATKDNKVITSIEVVDKGYNGALINPMSEDGKTVKIKNFYVYQEGWPDYEKVLEDSDKTYLDSKKDWYLAAPTVYLSDNYTSIRFNLKENNEDKIWIEPTLMLQNTVPSIVVSRWSGNDFGSTEDGIDYNVMSIVGKKNTDNEFTGVIIGGSDSDDIDSSLESSAISVFKNNEQTVKISEGGDAYFKGRINAESGSLGGMELNNNKLYGSIEAGDQQSAQLGYYGINTYPKEESMFLVGGAPQLLNQDEDTWTTQISAIPTENPDFFVTSDGTMYSQKAYMFPSYIKFYNEKNKNLSYNKKSIRDRSQIWLSLGEWISIEKDMEELTRYLQNRFYNNTLADLLNDIIKVNINSASEVDSFSTDDTVVFSDHMENVIVKRFTKILNNEFIYDKSYNILTYKNTSQHDSIFYPAMSNNSTTPFVAANQPSSNNIVSQNWLFKQKVYGVIDKQEAMGALGSDQLYTSFQLMQDAGYQKMFILIQRPADRYFNALANILSFCKCYKQYSGASFYWAQQLKSVYGLEDPNSYDLGYADLTQEEGYNLFGDLSTSTSSTSGNS